MSSDTTKPAPRKTIDITKNAKYTVVIGESLRKPGSAAAKEYTSIRYNHKPASVLANGKKSVLKPKTGGKSNEVSLEITPNDVGDDPVLFEGAEEPAKATECILLYDPATGTFTLEKITSTFVVNEANGTHPALRLPPETANSGSDGEPDAADALDPSKADPENPFDFRHFLDNTFEVPLARREDQARKAERDRANNELDLSGATSSGSDAEESSSKEREKDADGDLIFEDPDDSPPRVATPPPPPRRPAPKAKAATTKATPATTTKKLPASTRTKNAPLNLPTTISPALTPNVKRPRSPSPPPYNAESDADNSDDEDEDAEMSDSGELIIEDDGLIIDEGDAPARPPKPRFRPPPSAPIQTFGGHRVLDDGSSSGSDSEDEPPPPPRVTNGVGLTPPVQAAPQEDSSDEDDNTYGHVVPQQEDEDEISDVDEDSDAPQQQQHQQQKPQEDDADVSDVDEEEDFDLQAAFEAELLDVDEPPAPAPAPRAVGQGPISMGGRRIEDDESSSEEE